MFSAGFGAEVKLRLCSVLHYSVYCSLSQCSTAKGGVTPAFSHFSSAVSTVEKEKLLIFVAMFQTLRSSRILVAKHKGVSAELNKVMCVYRPTEQY